MKQLVYSFKVPFLARNPCEKVRKIFIDMFSVKVRYFGECYAPVIGVDILVGKLESKGRKAKINLVLWDILPEENKKLFNSDYSVSIFDTCYLRGSQLLLYIPAKIDRRWRLRDGSVYSLNDVKKIYREWGVTLNKTLKKTIKLYNIPVMPLKINTDQSIDENLESLLHKAGEKLLSQIK